jgi:hypothetical protein
VGQSKLPESSVWYTVATLPEGKRSYLSLDHLRVDLDRNIWVEAEAYCSGKPVFLNSEGDRHVPIKKVGNSIEIPAFVFEKRFFKLHPVDHDGKQYLSVVIGEDKE